MELFDTVYDEYHQFAMGNLYDYAAFSGAAYNNKFKVLCHDVMRKFGRGLPPSVIHKELKIKKVQLEAQRTTNASVLQGEPKWPNIVASSVYDTKPVHYLSVVSSDL